MRNYLQYTAVIIVFIVCCGCTAAQQQSSAAYGAPKTEDINNQVLDQLRKVRLSDDYLLQPGDLIEVKVFMENGMDRTVRISGQGFITFPMVGNIKISGHSVSSAEAAISQGLKKYLLNPQVSMLIKEYGNKTVYVLGQVTKPSAIQLPPERPLTVLEAISSVGGFTEIAAQSKVRVLRETDGKHQNIDIDVSQITKMGDKSLDIALKPGDVVFVPQSLF